MKIWIVYDSKFGSNKIVAESMKKLLDENHDVSVNYAKDISPKKVLAERPDIFLFGGPRRIGKISYTIRKWVEKFAKLVISNNITLKKVGAWETKGEMKKEDMDMQSGMERKIYEKNLALVEKWNELIHKFPSETPPLDVLELYIVGMEEGKMELGKLEPNAQEKIKNYVLAFENS